MQLPGSHLTRERLENDDIIVEVSPACGASLTRFDYKLADQRVPILRRCDDSLVDQLSPFGASCFPLLPYSNRLRDGRFEAGGRQYQHSLNCPPEKHSSHGDAWMRQWRIGDTSDSHIELLLDPDDSQPIKYLGSQIVQLQSNTVSIQIRVTNKDDVRAPFGMGIHPYFSRFPDTELACRLDRQWVLDEELMPLRNVANPLNVKMAKGILVRDLPQSGAFHSISANAQIIWPSSGLRLDIESDPPMQHAIIWCPSDQDFFCYEPVSHMVDGFNAERADIRDTGVMFLDPNQSFEATWTFSVSVESESTP
jgi:aldose 1-epimerase